MQRHSPSTRAGTRAKLADGTFSVQLYEIKPWSCQPRRSKQKNRVEDGVELAQRRIIATMERERTPDGARSRSTQRTSKSETRRA